MVKKAVFFSILIILYGFLSYTAHSGENDIDATSSASEILEDIPKLDTKSPEKTKPKIDTKIDSDSMNNEKTEITKINPVEEIKITESKKPEIILKLEEKDNKIQTSTIDDIIVLSAENLGDNKNLENKYRETKLIIFENSNEKIPTSLTYELQEEKTSDIRYYESPDFLPKTEMEFELAKPEFTYNADKTIISGKIQISAEIGENIFKTAFEEFKKGDIHGSKSRFEKLINFGHRVPESAYYTGLCYYLDRDNIKAINYLEFAVKSGMENMMSQNQISVFLFQAGYIYYELDDSKNALDMYFMALEKNPTNANIYTGIGLVYYKNNDVDNALSYWKKGMDAGNANCAANYNWLISKISK